MREEVMISLSRKELEEMIYKSVMSALSESTSDPTSKELMTFEETRDYLSISSSTLFKWKKEGKIPFRWIGKRIYFHKGEILHTMKDSKCENSGGEK